MSAEFGVLVSLALAVGAVFLVARPFRTLGRAEYADSSELAELLAQRENAFQTLRDLDSDLAAGRLAEDDYRPMRVQALAQAAEIVAKIDEYAPLEIEPSNEATPPASNGRDVTLGFCANCGAEREPYDVFCGRCGRKLKPA